MFAFWMNTAFVRNNYLVLEKHELDGAAKDKSNSHFSPEFKIELFFEPAVCVLHDRTLLYVLVYMCPTC